MTYESPGNEDLRMDIGALLAAVWARSLRIVLVTVLLLATTYGVLTFVPRLYESTAAVLVEPRNSVYLRPTGEVSTGGPSFDESVMSSQIELIKSRDTLVKVVEQLQLRSVKEFGAPEPSLVDRVMQLVGRKLPVRETTDDVVIGNLESRLLVMRERDSRVISISVRAQDPELAAKIANAIADAHVQRRADLSLSDTAEASVWLAAEIEKLRVRVGEAEAKVAEFRVKNELFAGTNNTSLLDQQLSTISSQIAAAQERKNAAASRANLISGLVAEGKPIEGVADIRESVAVQQLMQEKARLQGERAQMLATMLATHPTVRAITAQIAELDQQIIEEGRRVADALAAEAEIEGDLIASLQGELARAKVGVSTATQETVTLNELEREAKASRDLLESYMARYREATSRTDASAAFPDVRVVTEATPALVPASPKSALILLAVAIVSLALQVGWILFGELLSGRAVVVRETFARRDEPLAGEQMQASTSFTDEEVEPARSGPTFGAEIEPSPALLALPAEMEQNPTESIAEDAESDSLPMMAEPDEVEAMPEPSPFVTLTEDLVHLSEEIAAGRVRVVMLADIASHRESVGVADMLVEDALIRGISVAVVDAGSGKISQEPGLTDLTAEHVSFGDVVHRTALDGLAQVPWGHLPVINRRSTRPITLLDALADIYELVIIQTGRVGMASTLPLFAGAECRLLLVGTEFTANAEVEAVRADIAALGYEDVQLVTPPKRAEVA